MCERSLVEAHFYAIINLAYLTIRLGLIDSLAAGEGFICTQTPLMGGFP